MVGLWNSDVKSTYVWLYEQAQVLDLIGGSGEIRTRDQRIKRSHCSSKLYINQWPKGQKNDCAIKCAISYWYKVRILLMTEFGFCN